MFRIVIFALIFMTSACAYRFGLSERQLPGGYSEVAIPVFHNGSQDVGIEVPFTNALVRRFSRSQVARVTDKESSPITIEGNIVSVGTDSVASVTNTSGLTTLPEGAVLTSEYRLTIVADMRVKRKSDDKVIWAGRFSGEKSYAAPRLGRQVLNSANATYNHSVRMETIAQIAEEMMTEAHDRMTENF